MLTLSLPPSLDFLEPPLLDDLSTLPADEQERLRQRLTEDPAFALGMARALFDMVMVQGSLTLAGDDVLTPMLDRLAGKVRDDDPDCLALRHRYLLHAGHRLLNVVHVNDRPRLAQRLLRLNTLLEHPGPVPSDPDQASRAPDVLPA